ncbi:phosphoglycolate phosphatase [Jhaorihella thermophila]|uniref:phosphoglycolate phosphatase n=2 Tax=Jhaorihella thermophila TaxID=488547 RepID=A0A1H5T942_9RHOB|nr:phosphoglycolate phosphatase [Jhaorihella thermophila]
MTMRVDAILFDKDGTLFDFATTWGAWARAFLLRATGGDTARCRLVGAEIGYDFDTGRFDPSSIVIAGTTAEAAEALLPHFPEMGRHALIALLNEEAARAPQAEAVPLVPLLDDLRGRGLRLGVATNDSEGPARAHLRGAGVLDRFDFVAGFDSGHGAKPEPGPLLAFADHVAANPNRIAMVGDSLHDLVAGRAAGMVTVAVLTGLATHDDLAPHADVVLPDIGHIPGWLDG